MPALGIYRRDACPFLVVSSPNPPTLITLLSTLFLTASCSGAEPPGRESGGGGGITSPPGANDGGDDPTPTGGETEGASDGSDSSPSGGGSDPSGGSDTWFPDVGQFPDVSQSDCEGDEPGGLEFTYIWIANSTQGTVSKIDTGTGVEVGRYATGANSRQPVTHVRQPVRRSGGRQPRWWRGDHQDRSRGT